MTDIKKISISGNEYDIKDANALRIADQGNLLPNFDVMPVLQTVEFDTSDSNYHTIFTRTNTETNPKDVVDSVYFRITVTGTNINYVADCVWILKGQANTFPILIINYKPGTSDSAYCGFRYIREVYPKALNNGYGWALEVLQNRNNNARHYKIEVFKTNSKYTWTQGTATTYNSTYHNSAQYGAETTSGYFINYITGTVGQAGNASGLNDRLNKNINTNFTTGEALLANQFIYMNSNKHYPATNKTKAIEPGYGIQFNNTAYNANTDAGWDRIRQKQRITSLTNVPHATLAKGNPCYFRCTMDANGNILSDNYVATSMTNGYTWYYIGVAESSTAIALDTTQSFFITLDSNGVTTHINGKPIPQGTVKSVNNVAPVNGNVTLSIPAAQVNSDWNATSGVAKILNKPTIDQTYNASSTNAQSGTAVANAISSTFVVMTASEYERITPIANVFYFIKES